MEAHQSSRWVSTSRPSDSAAIEHLLNLSLEIGFKFSREVGLAPQETAQAWRGLGLELDKPHEWLDGAGDHHLLTGQGLVDIARQNWHGRAMSRWV